MAASSSKQKDQQQPRHSHSEEEMRRALAALMVGKPQEEIHPHYDTAEAIIGDLIDELLEHRARFERFRGFVQQEYMAMQRR